MSQFCNNSNESHSHEQQVNLNDCLEVLEIETGPLTDDDRIIPKEELQVICEAMYQSEYPIIDIHCSKKYEERKNNYLPIAQQMFVKMPSRKAKVENLDREDMVRRSERNRTQSQRTLDLDITSGLNRLRVSQPSVGDDEEVDDEEEHSSSSESDDDSSGSEYQPDEQSSRTRCGRRRSRRDSSSPSTSPFEPPQSSKGSRRLLKADKKRMSEADLVRRRREANKRNSKNYNKNKKELEKRLMGEVAVNRDHIERTKRINENIDNKIKEGYGHIGITIETPEMDGFIDRESYLRTREEIDEVTRKSKRRDNNLRDLAKTLQIRNSRYERAKNDQESKKTKTNTYGSRKSRALHDLNIARYEYELASLKYEIERLAKWENLMRSVRHQFAVIFNMKDTSVSGWFQLGEHEKQRFEALVAFFRRSSPLRS